MRTEKLLRDLNLQTVCLLGMAGSLEQDVKLGDVVVAEEINQFQAASKAVPDGERFKFTYSGNHWPLAHRLRQCVTNFRYAGRALYQEWQTQGAADLTKHVLAEAERMKAAPRPQVHSGHCASGDTVSAATAYRAELLGIDRKFKMIEMEAAGVARAAHDRASPAQVLVVRGISDPADEDKIKLDKESCGVWRRYAVANAARFLRGLLRHRDFISLLPASDM
jgi:nucleoside phosphorylase